MLPKVKIYTDGSCKCNPGPGGWGAILVFDSAQKHIEKEMSGGESNTTNNRMELTAAIEALKALKVPCEVELTTDSRYLCDGITKGWAKSWKENNWKRSDKSQALNTDLWDILLNLCAIHQVKITWVKGHAGHPFNERCDAMAQKEAGKYQNEESGI